MTGVHGTEGAGTPWGGGRLPSSVVDPKAGRRRSEVPTPPQPDPTIPPDPLPPEPDAPAPDPPHSETQGCGGVGAPAEVALDDLVLRPVNEAGRRIGTVEDVVLNCTLGRVLGVDVVCGDRRRFVPWVTLSVRDEELALTVPLNGVPRGLSLLLAHGTRLSETWHGTGVMVDRLGELRPSVHGLASTGAEAAWPPGPFASQRVP